MTTDSTTSVQRQAQAEVSAPAPARKGAMLDAATAIAALVGLADAVYLTVSHMTGQSLRCVVVSGCDAVLASRYATLPGGIPLAALGAFAYFAVFSLATLAAFGYTSMRRPLAILAALMFAATLYLLYLQAFVLGSFCSYCLLSALMTTIIVASILARRLIARP
ncbi:MAG TPA: vitamin K epoxide reductase family protein [Pyrinomonadaceae bacterium]|nr:vitamin K epoxide reductase family protein [Pyrinomonadaceae bacterium]